MTPRQLGTSPDGASPFDELMAEVMATADRFGHREHVHLTWLAVQRFGMPAAIGLVSEGIQRTARYAGAPQKYNATVSQAWVELVAYHAAGRRDDDFAVFASRYPSLLAKRVLTRHYRPATLASQQARTGWVEPDLAPFPWHDAGRPRPGWLSAPASCVEGLRTSWLGWRHGSSPASRNARRGRP
ncbi:MAG TPA: hypothetical protein VMU94_29040 [Streptosporangiaceae bacterium]|nr:hypothetical protein [Streptosporangiaceae bacterium]